ncbi:uncharacterized protein BJX67DRAFT_180738 [Aspergillus lucknowensis]|uniref:Uncharacterized protein n=1 Tax=Aspergillus lucknowensis TaxID=176173 RepID=A0ABR4LM26_9EURO
MSGVGLEADLLRNAIRSLRQPRKIPRSKGKPIAQGAGVSHHRSIVGGCGRDLFIRDIYSLLRVTYRFELHDPCLSPTLFTSPSTRTVCRLRLPNPCGRIWPPDPRAISGSPVLKLLCSSTAEELENSKPIYISVIIIIIVIIISTLVFTRKFHSLTVCVRRDPIHVEERASDWDN